MSDPPRWTRVCEQERSIGLDAAAFCIPIPSALVSPIDNFYSYIESVVLLGKKEELDINEALGKVLLLGVVSATEHYFRAVLAGLIDVCPLVRKRAASFPLSFGALDYYPREELGLALLENVSLATAGEIQKQTDKLVGIHTDQDSSTKASLIEYEKLCQFRHAAVHARGDLGHQNLQQLGVPPISGRLALRVEFSGFQSAAAISQNVVRSYNRLLFRRSVERWIGEKVLRAKWSDDHLAFSRLFRLFYSTRDSQIPKSPYHAYRNLLPSLRKPTISI